MLCVPSFHPYTLTLTFHRTRCSYSPFANFPTADVEAHVARAVTSDRHADAAVGAMVGMAIADAIGAPLEFLYGVQSRCTPPTAAVHPPPLYTYVLQSNATQRNASSRNATQALATQRNASSCTKEKRIVLHSLL